MHVKWLKRALLDLDAVEVYIAQDNPSAADDVVLKILKAVSLLKEQPGLGRFGRGPVPKSLLFLRFPTSYLIGSKENISKFFACIIRLAPGHTSCNSIYRPRKMLIDELVQSPY